MKPTGRLKRIAALVGTIIAVIAVASGVVWFAPIFKVADVQVIGAKHNSSEDIVEASGIGMGDNLVRLNATEAAHGVAHVPWVRSATIDRELPDTVTITVVERTPILFLGSRDEHATLIDDTGIAFTTETPPEGTIEFAGEQASIDARTLDAVVHAVAALDDDLRGQIASVAAPTDAEIGFTLKDSRTVYWGASEHNAEKARAMRTALSREGEHWNVSSPNQISVR